MPWIGSTMKAATSPPASARLERRQIVPGDAHGVGEQRPEAVAEDGVAVERQRAHRQAVEGMVAVDQLCPAGGLACQLDRRLDRLGPRVAEEDALLPRHARDELLGQHPRQRRDVHLHGVGEIGGQHVGERALDRRVIAPDGEDAEPGEQIEVALPLAVVEVGPLGAHVVAIEADRLEHLDHLRVQVLLVQRELLAGARLQRVEDPAVVLHAAPPRGRAGRQRRLGRARQHLGALTDPLAQRQELRQRARIARTGRAARGRG